MAAVRGFRWSAGWLLAAGPMLAALACGGHVAHSQQAPEASKAPAPIPAWVEPSPLAATSAAGTTPDQDEAAAELAVAESELPAVATEVPTAVAASEAPAPIVVEDAPQPLVVPVSIEEARDVQSMAGFHRALVRAAAGEGKARILFYGASHVAADIFTGRIRDSLQAQFGDAGAGFVMPAKPWPHYRHTLVEHVESTGWHAPRVRARHPVEGRFGLAGVALEAGDRAALAKLQTRSAGVASGNASQFELMYLKQPDGGRVQVMLDGQALAMLSTAGTATQPAYFPFVATDGPHAIEIATFADGPVTIFGLTMERDEPGVVLDMVGIPGARARYHLFWDDALYREHVTHRSPDLIVLAYGTNEAGDKDVPIDDYERELRDVVGRLRTVAPGASCLLVGPSDRPERRPDRTYMARDRVPEIVEAQRRTALALGCGFFDLVAFMGGPLSMVRWAAAVPPFGAPDHVHYTRRGYEALGDALFNALTAGYGADVANPRAPVRSAR